MLAERLGESLKGLQVPQAIVEQILSALQEDQGGLSDESTAERSRLEGHLHLIRNRMDDVYTDKLDGKVTEEFGSRKHKLEEWSAFVDDFRTFSGV